MLSTSPKKEADAKRLGAHAFELTSDRGTMKKLAGRFHLMIDTISVDHDLNAHLALLRTAGRWRSSASRRRRPLWRPCR